MLGPLRLSNKSFEPSDAGPALLSFRAGQLAVQGGRDAVQPLALLSLELLDSDGNELGTLATLRDLLPGRYAFGLTGRTPAGNTLAARHVPPACHRGTEPPRPREPGSR